MGLGLLCGLFGKSRQAWHKGKQAEDREAFEAGLLLPDIRRLRAQLPGAGAEKLHHLLVGQGVFARWGIKMGRDKLGGLLGREGLGVQRKKRGKRTTDSKHGHERYRNLLKDKETSGVGQSWVSDITYVPVLQYFAYLTLVTDAHPRKIVGWHLSRDLGAAGCMAALRTAIAGNRGRLSGLVHHSDRGIQYCCREYVQTLKQHGIQISMTENGDPYENALAERMNRTIKEEMLQNRRFLSFEEARQAVERAITLYNRMRPHASPGFLTPQQAHRENAVSWSCKWGNQKGKQQQNPQPPKAATCRA